MLQLGPNKGEKRRVSPAFPKLLKALTTIAVVVGTANCGHHGESPEGWEVVEVRTPHSTEEVSAFAEGTVIAVQDDKLVLTLGDAQVRVAGKVSHSNDGGASVALPDGRKVRWERVGEHHARLVWPGKGGSAVLELAKQVAP